ncbi:hypothetical protein KN1_12710 [Stygiolobus caldivivus]|uniref:Uncharacterized protein n=1 Tax=Stygiolobus caldivivus TaxID=2824673 RepID=A0A8D5ZHT0_9CREN|nr:hypothetical protein KN1_12710 [Stygiolobus caldivivus]
MTTFGSNFEYFLHSPSNNALHPPEDLFTAIKTPLRRIFVIIIGGGTRVIDVRVPGGEVMLIQLLPALLYFFRYLDVHVSEEYGDGVTPNLEVVKV